MVPCVDYFSSAPVGWVPGFGSLEACCPSDSRAGGDMWPSPGMGRAVYIWQCWRIDVFAISEQRSYKYI